MFRRIVFTAILVLLALALLNVFGQRPTTASAESPAASLELDAPERVRSGLIYQARFRIDATLMDIVIRAGSCTSSSGC